MMNRYIAALVLALTFTDAAHSELQCTKDGLGNMTCRDASYPTPADLRDIYGTGPEAYLQGRRQVELANQIQEQKLQQLQLENQRSARLNDYEAQNNALRIENQRLKNEPPHRDNAEQRQKYGSEGVTLTAAQYQRLKVIGDDELRQIASQGQTLSLSTDQVTHARGQRLLQIARLALELRQVR